jgi:L-ribulokinase
MTKSKYALGLDFGTESARAVLANAATGDIVATVVHPYADGVVDEHLPGEDKSLPPDWALQNPSDWIAALEMTIPSVVDQSGIDPESIVGIGLDFTSCTVLPTTREGTPLSTLDEFRHRPHAWPKLWKHHSAQPQADRVNEVAAGRGEAWLPRYGGKISSEWLIPKALQILEDAPDIYATAAYIVEGADWVVWQLTGQLARNTCAAGYKGTWHRKEGYPSSDFLAALQPDLANLYSEKIAGPLVMPGQQVGRLTADWANRLSLVEGIPVAGAIIDAHSAVLGAGVGSPQVMLMIMGTSTCHMLMAADEVLVAGISGVVEDGIVPGLFGYEAGQAAVGDIFAWFVDGSVPPAYYEEAGRRGSSIHDVLAERADALRPGQSGLLALDWWNGNRSTLVDAELSGLLIGCTLATKPEDIYRALIEATGFGTRIIIETFVEQGVPVESIVTSGGLTKNELLMQIYADITNREIAVASTELASALGAAILGAVAAGREGGGYPTVAEAIAHMVSPPSRVYRPISGHVAPYDAIYAAYRRLYDYFGRGENEVMKALRQWQQSFGP